MLSSSKKRNTNPNTITEPLLKIPAYDYTAITVWTVTIPAGTSQSEMMPTFKEKMGDALKLMQLFCQSFCILHPTDDKAQRYYAAEEFPPLFVHLRNHMNFRDKRNFNSGMMNKWSRKIIVSIKIGMKEEPKKLLTSAQIYLNTTDVKIDYQPLQEYNHGDQLYQINYPNWANPDLTGKALQDFLIKFQKNMMKTWPRLYPKSVHGKPFPKLAMKQDLPLITPYQPRKGVPAKTPPIGKLST